MKAEHIVLAADWALAGFGHLMPIEKGMPGQAGACPGVLGTAQAAGCRLSARGLW